jgi:type I restriction enzyme M protein
LGETNDSSFTYDLHKELYFDYIMANPPFHLKGWYDPNLKDAPRWADYETPPASNANYAWILHILSHLKKTDGVAGFLMANGALNDSDALEIRKKLVHNDKVEAIVILPRELFITTDISVTLWILKQNKKKVRLDETQIQRASDIYHTWQCEGADGMHYEVPELYRSVSKDEIEANKWSLVPSKYIEFIDHDLDIDFHAKMTRIQKEMQEVLATEKQSQKMMEETFRGIGYGIS